MSISVRLDAETEAALRRRLRAQEIPLSVFVRQAIQEKLKSTDKARTPYELGKGLFGRYGSGEPDRSARRKEIVKNRMDAKHRRR